MNGDDIILEASRAAVAGTARRIVTDSNRHRWEQQWMRENGAVSGVVDNGDNDAAGSASPQQAGTAPTTARQRFWVEQQLQPLPVDTERAPSPTRAVTSETGTFNTTANESTGEAFFSLGVAPERETPSAAQPVDLESRAALTSRHKGDGKQFALWRTDDEVKISMRLQQSDGEGAEMLGALRSWLKDMRLKLTALTVNGQVRWQSKPKNTDGY